MAKLVSKEGSSQAYSEIISKMVILEWNSKMAARGRKQKATLL
jgi:hypothetical protein